MMEDSSVFIQGDEYATMEEVYADPGNTVLEFDDGSILVVGGWNAD